MANVYVIEEGTTNLFPNPGASLTTDWLYPARGTLERVPATVGHSGYAFKYTTDETVGSYYVMTNSGSVWGNYRYPISSQSVTFSFLVRNPERSFIVRAFFQDAAGNNLPQQNSALIPIGDWRRESTTFTPPTGAATISFYVILQGANIAGHTLELTDVQLEEKPYATSLTHGDMGEGYSWTGTPHNSPSIREEASISMPSPEPESLYIRYSEDGEIWNNQYVSFEDKPEDIEPTLLLSPDGSRDRNGVIEPTIVGDVQVVGGKWVLGGTGYLSLSDHTPDPISPRQGTIIARITPYVAIPTTSTHLIRRGSASNGGYVAIYQSHSGGSWTAFTRENDVNSGVTGSPQLPIGQPAWIAMTWTEDEVKSANSASAVWSSVARTYVEAAFANTAFTIGGSPALDADLESFLIYDTALSDAEIARISTMPEAWTWENSSDLRVRLNLGEHSELTRYQGAIRLRTAKKLYIGTVIGFSRPLSQKEIEVLDSTPLEYISGKTLLNLPETTVGVSQLL